MYKLYRQEISQKCYLFLKKSSRQAAKIRQARKGPYEFLADYAMCIENRDKNRRRAAYSFAPSAVLGVSAR